MKKLWHRIAERVDAASLRERVFIFAAASAILVALVQSAFLQPEFATQRRVAAEVAQRQGETKALQMEITRLLREREADPDRPVRERLLRLQASLDEAGRRIAVEQARFTAPDQMRHVVQEILSRNRGVKLVDMKTSPPAPITEDQATDARATGPKAVAAAAAERQIFRHGMELTVTGSYLDVLAYVRDLERLPTQLYWTSLELSVSQYPSLTAKLKVYTLSLDRAWMSV